MDRNKWYYRFKADVNWLDQFIENIETGFENLVVAMSQTPGVVTGYTVSERALGQNFSVDVASGWAYDVFGRRVYNSATTNVPFTDTYDGDPITCTSGGNERIVSIYAFYDLAESDPVVDGNGDTVYTTETETVEFRLYQGAIAPAGTAVAAANPNDGSVLLADVTIATGDSTIADADIDNSVADSFSTLVGTVGEAEILFGLGSNEVSAEDIPLRDTGLNFTTDDVESALAELAGRADDLEADVGSIPPALINPSFTAGDILYASSTTALAQLAAAASGNVLLSGTAPSWGKVALTTHISGTLPVANGGTNLTSYTAGDLLYASSSSALSKLAGVATGNVLISGGVGAAPSYGKVGLTTHVSGTLPVANGGTGATTSTGSGSVVLSAGPTFSGGITVAGGGTVSGTWTFSTNVLNVTSSTVQVGTTSPISLSSDSYLFSIVASDTEILALESTATGTSGPMLSFYHSSTTPADGDVTGYVRAYGKNDAAQDVEYARIEFRIEDVRDGQDDGNIAFRTNRLGTMTDLLVLDSNSMTAYGDFDPDASATYDLGFSGGEWDDVYCVTLHETSDRRLKTNIENLNLGLDFVKKLKPVTYKRKFAKKHVFKEEAVSYIDKTTGKKVVKTKIKKSIVEKNEDEKRTHVGFIAQDVEKVTGNELAIVCKGKKSDSYSLRYTQFIPILTKAIQELSEKFSKLEKAA